jgi:hypothetical protein
MGVEVEPGSAHSELRWFDFDDVAALNDLADRKAGRLIERRISAARSLQTSQGSEWR